MSNQEQNKADIRRVIDEVWNRGNMAFLDDVCAPDYVCHMPGQDLDREGYKGMAQSWLTVVPDNHVTIEDMVGEGDMLAFRYTMMGTHQKAWLGVSATGRRVRMVGMGFSRLADGKIVEEWFLDDIAGVLRQVGATPTA